MPKKKTKKKSAPRRKKGKKSNSAIWIWSLLIFGGVVVYLLLNYRSIKRTQTPSEFTKSLPKGYNSVGLDVSHHQGEIDWDYLLKEKGYDTILDFVYCKITEGSDHIDKQWKRNREYLNNHGIPNGVYHYLNTKSEAHSQAQHFLANYSIRSIDLPPVIDVEDEGETDEALRKLVDDWCKEVQQATGIKPIIYTSLSFYETKFKNQLKGYNYWLAAYSREPQYMNENEVLHWQFSEKGRLPGIEGNVDINVSKLRF